MKKLFLTLFSISTFAFAQNDTIWMSKFHSLTTKQSAEYFRIIKKNDQKTIQINEYRLDKSKMLEQLCNLNEDKTFNGQATQFFENGKTAVIYEIKNSAINGKVISFLKNGSKTECIYKNNMLFDGNIIFETKGLYAQHIAKNGLPVVNKYYSLDNENSGYVETFINEIKTCKSFDKNGKIIGEAIYNKDFEVVSGILGEYSHDSPLRLEKIVYYKNKSIIKEVSLIENGKIRDVLTINPKDKSQILETYDNNGLKIGVLTLDEVSIPLHGKSYTYESFSYNKQMPKSLDTYNGFKLLQSIEFDKNGIKKIQIDNNENGNCIGRTYYDTSGKITSKLTYSEPGKEEDGLKINDNHIQEFKNGKLISDKEFYNTGEIFSDEKADVITYFDKKGNKIGTIIGKKSENEFYLQPYDGIIYSYSKEYDTFSGYKKYKKGIIIEEVGYFLDNHLKNIIKKQKFYEDKRNGPVSYTNEGIPIKEIRNFENGNKKFEYTNYQGNYDGEFYKIISFDSSGKKIGEFDKNKNEGTQCFYYDQESDDLQSIETYKKGKLQYEKKFHQTKNFFGNIVTKIELFEEIVHF